MSLRWKIILLLAAVFGLYLTATRAIQESVMMPSFAALEREQAIDDIDRCVGAIKSEIRHLSMFCGDWSSWDDAYAFAEGRDAEFIKRNMMPSTFSTNQLSLICITAPDGRVLWQQGYNVPSMHPIAISPFIAGRLPETHPLVHHPDIRSQVGGVILTDRGPMLVVSRPILTSNEVGPIRGAMIMGRLLTEKQVHELAERTRVTMRIWAISDTPIAPDEREALGALEKGSRLIIRQSSPETLFVYKTVTDIDGKPGLLVRADIPRRITARGKAAAGFALATDIAAAGVILLLTWASLQRIVVQPLSRLTAHAVTVGSKGDLSSALDLRARDEIGSLTREFNRMVHRLADSQAKLLDTAHRAGMAEIATAVLHNIGNAVTSVGVSAELLDERLQECKASDLRQVADLLDANTGGGGAAQHNAVAAYLRKLADVIVGQNETALDALRTLQDKVRSIKETVRAQQTNAMGPQYREDINPSAMADDVLRLCEDELHRRGIRAIREHNNPAGVRANPQVLRQVIENLVRNSIDAMLAFSTQDPTLTVRTYNQDDQVVIEIADTGVGVPPAIRDRVFQNGFTTKGQGHGFGLHFCANAMRRMGGGIELCSEGEGKGSTVRLKLPACATGVAT